MNATGFIHHPRCLDHFAGPGHPERPERIAAILERLSASGLGTELSHEAAAPAELERVHAAHDPRYVRAIASACEGGRSLLDQGDTYVCEASYEAALLAAGGAIQAVERVLAGEWRNAFVAVRPPGHHAGRANAMGFCLLNNVGIAALRLRAEPGVERVAIVDWDVHHGNGTQALFERDPSVFYASLHQYPHWPGTGAASERGIGPGEGATLNCPLAPGSGEREWLAAFEGQVLPALEDFGPQFLLVSAGFDAHRDDPLSATRLEENAFAHMARGVLELARRTAKGRVVALLEGGYHLGALARSVEATLGEMVAA